MPRMHAGRAGSMRARQRVGRTGPVKQSKIARSQVTVDKWKRGTDALEEKFAKVRATKHTFVPMGRLPACELCGSNRDDLLNGRRIHPEEKR